MAGLDWCFMGYGEFGIFKLLAGGAEFMSQG